MADTKCAFYFSEDIMSLCRCGKNLIPQLEARGVIPKHIRRPKGSREEKRWLKSTVDRKLGLEKKSIDTDLVRELIQQELVNVFRAQRMSENS